MRNHDAGMTRRSVFGLAAVCCCAWSFRPRTVSAQAFGHDRALNLPKEVLGIRIPDSALARGAATLARTESPNFLFNHCMRTFVFAGLAARRMGRTYDEEAVFVACALHDLALMEKYEVADKTFERAGADFARGFARAGGFSEERAELVWQGIALHTSRVPDGAAFDVKMVQIGAGMDVFGFPPLSEMPWGDVEAVVREFPRAAFNKAFKDLLVAHGKRRPQHAGENDWIGAFTRAADAREPIVEKFDNSPWRE